MSARETQMHSLRRTSPKGENFVGTCVLCGTPNLTFADMNSPCPNQRGLSEEQALLDAIKGPASQN